MREREDRITKYTYIQFFENNQETFEKIVRYIHSEKYLFEYSFIHGTDLTELSKNEIAGIAILLFNALGIHNHSLQQNEITLITSNTYLTKLPFTNERFLAITQCNQLYFLLYFFSFSRVLNLLA